MRLRLGQSGFTLVELLVSISLMSLVALTLLGAFRGAGQIAAGFDRVQQKMELQQSVHAGFAQLFRTGFALPDPAGKLNSFNATPDHLTWTGVMPARFGLSGRYVFRLALEANPTAKNVSQLVLRYRKWTTAGEAQANESAQVLLDDVQSMVISYSGQQLNGQWVSSWVGQKEWPDRLKVRLRQTGMSWPDMVFYFHTSTTQGVASFGGSK